MQRRLELACALVHEPALIILDEPTAGHRPAPPRATIWDELHRLRDAGRTLLVTTQHVSEAEECDAVALIAGGRIIALAHARRAAPEATGGDLLDIETDATFDGRPRRHARRRRGPAGRAASLPRRRRRRRHGAAASSTSSWSRPAATSSRPARYRLSFDEVFAILVERHADGRGEAASGGRGGRRGGRGMSLFPRPSPGSSRSSGKELVEVVRRPGALISLVFGPFLIMALFGVGYSGYRRPLDTIVVIPPRIRPAPPTRRSTRTLPARASDIVDVVPDESAAASQARERARSTSSSSPPTTPRQQFEAGKQ